MSEWDELPEHSFAPNPDGGNTGGRGRNPGARAGLAKHRELARRHSVIRKAVSLETGRADAALRKFSWDEASEAEPADPVEARAT